MKASLEEVLPPAVTTPTSTAPAEPAGVVAVIEVSELIVKEGASTPPKVTALVVVRPVPVIVTWVPPATGPSEGPGGALTLEMVGGPA